MPKIKQLAFTLIELLVVIAVIGILSGLIVVSMSGTTQKATIAKSQIFSNSLRNSLMSNLVSEWKLDGNGNDTWGSNTGIITGAVTAATGCVYDSCLTMDGNDYVKIPTSSSLDITTNITISAWAKVTDKTAQGTIVSKMEAGAYSIIVNATSYPNQVSGWVYVGGGYKIPVFSTSYINNNEWFFVVLTYDGTNTKIYLNGNFMNAVPGTGAIGTTTTDFYIGAESSTNTTPTTPFLVGSVDEIRIFNAGIPLSQIREQYFSGLNSLLVKGQITSEYYASQISFE
jgi:prepilin-type N-terminal cleavage/methylation domain-containing protein